MRICTNIGQIFFPETAAMSFHPTFTTPESRQINAPCHEQRAVKEAPQPHGGKAEKYDRDQIDKRHRDAEALRNGILCHAVSRFSAHNILHSTASSCNLDLVQKQQARRNAPPRLFFSKIRVYTRFHFAPPGISVTSTPCALSSSRMRSASAKFFAFLASAR